MLKYIPSIPLLESFYHEWILNFVKTFSAPIDQVVFSLEFVNVMVRDLR